MMSVRFLAPAAVLLIACPSMVQAQEAAVAADPAWKTSIHAGLTLTDGNSDTLNTHAGIEAHHGEGPLLVRIGAMGHYGETEGETTTQKAEGFAHIKRLLDEAWYAYADASILHDEPGGVDYRLVAGPGLGRFLVKSETETLWIEAGVSYVREELKADESLGGGSLSDDFAAVRLAQRYEIAVSETATFWQALEYLPRIGEWDEYLLRAEAGIETAVSGRLSLRVAVDSRYDSDPAPGRETNDLTVTASLVFTL